MPPPARAALTQVFVEAALERPLVCDPPPPLSRRANEASAWASALTLTPSAASPVAPSGSPPLPFSFPVDFLEAALAASEEEDGSRPAAFRASSSKHAAARSSTCRASSRLTPPPPAPPAASISARRARAAPRLARAAADQAVPGYRFSRNTCRRRKIFSAKTRSLSFSTARARASSARWASSASSASRLRSRFAAASAFSLRRCAASRFLFFSASIKALW
mmetsp:Transcript_58089/g.84981  ORF Transcript_58089/g.84981 Transcript_58089/m.84981 type:complete len:221 (-) Transcript_58089:253-915(-)